jgi:hypothetical protein
MRRITKVLLLSATIALVWAPIPARADGYISPFLGTNFGNNSGDGRTNFGVNAGSMGAGIIGGELDFGYAPNFFGNQGTFGSNSVTDVMGNLIVGVPVGGTHGAGVRPYVTVGAGLIRSQITGGVGNSIVEVSDNEVGVNAGAGVMGFASKHVGVRGDVRYFRTVSGNSTLNNIDFGSFHFWRASIGIVLR